MKQKITTWLNTTNEAYSQLAGIRTTNGMIVVAIAAILGFSMLMGVAQMIEDAI